MRDIVLIAHNIRSTHNVGALFRTAEGLGVKKMFLTGYSPYPMMNDDVRLPHIAQKTHAQIEKTALNTTSMLPWEYEPDVISVIHSLQTDSYKIVALEQTNTAISLPRYNPPQHIALVLGNEINGVEENILQLCDEHIVIPMLGNKESFNVVHAAAIAMYVLRFTETPK